MSNQDQCNHAELQKLSGPLHPGGKDYVCLDCGEQFLVEPAAIRVGFGKPPAAGGESK